MVTVRHGDEYVPAAQVRLLPLPALAIRLLVNLEGRRRAHPPEFGFKLSGVVLNGAVRWREDREGDAEFLAERLSDALGWLVANGLLAPSADDGVWRVSERGRRVAKEQDMGSLLAEQRLAVDMHTALDNARSIFALGTHDAAVLEAMKQVEERVRQLSGLAGLGADLMRRAFSPGKPGTAAGPLADPGVSDPNESRGVMELFAGAIAAFRNPAAHRPIDYSDPTEAAEVILLADLLLRMLERVTPRTGP